MTATAERAGAAVAYTRLAESSEAFRSRVRIDQRPPASGGWVSAHEVVRSPVLLERLLDATAERLEAEYGARPSQHVVVTRVLHDYAWPVCLLISLPWLLGEGVPDLRLADVHVELSSGVLAVPADLIPCASSPSSARDASLLAAVAGHLAPVVGAVGPHSSRRPGVLWGVVTDDLVSGIWHAGLHLGDEVGAVSAAARLLPARTPPFVGGACFRTLVADDGVPHLVRTRIACCLRYRLAPEACLTCPRVADAERAARLAEPGP